MHDSTVQQLGGKLDTFTNTFSAGKLAITKTVTGNLGDKEREFNIIITLTAPKNEDDSFRDIKNTVQVDGVDVTFTSGVAKLNKTIKHGQTINITNIPYGVTYTVTEEDYTEAPDNYTSPTYNFSDEGEVRIIDNSAETVGITNHKEGNVETGIFLDNIPYIMIILVAVGGLVGFTVRKRRINEQ